MVIKFIGVVEVYLFGFVLNFGGFDVFLEGIVVEVFVGFDGVEGLVVFVGEGEDFEGVVEN